MASSTSPPLLSLAPCSRWSSSARSPASRPSPPSFCDRLVEGNRAEGYRQPPRVMHPFRHDRSGRGEDEQVELCSSSAQALPGVHHQHPSGSTPSFALASHLFPGTTLSSMPLLHDRLAGGPTSQAVVGKSVIEGVYHGGDAPDRTNRGMSCFT